MRACLRGVVGGQRAEGGGRWAEGFTSCPLGRNRTDPVCFFFCFISLSAASVEIRHRHMEFY